MPHIISNPLDLMANGRTSSSTLTLPLRGDSPAGSSSAVRSSQVKIIIINQCLKMSFASSSKRRKVCLARHLASCLDWLWSHAHSREIFGWVRIMKAIASHLIRPPSLPSSRTFHMHPTAPTYQWMSDTDSPPTPHLHPTYRFHRMFGETTETPFVRIDKQNFIFRFWIACKREGGWSSRTL